MEMIKMSYDLEKRIGLFKNFPSADFSKQENRERMQSAIEEINKSMGDFNYGLYIDGAWDHFDDSIESRNPSKTSELLGIVSRGKEEHIKAAVESAKKAANYWRNVRPSKRAGYLFDVAEQMGEHVYGLSAMIVCESGKNWKEAHADVAEAIDFLNFYGREMIRLGKEEKTQNLLGEENTTSYIPKGVVGVIAPWNFPLAILTGMTSAALVAGNTVVMKPAKDTPLIAGELMHMFANAGLPSGVLNYVPCSGKDAGRYIVENPYVNMVAFTGSKEVGLNMNKMLSNVAPGQKYIRSSILELGGKNGIIIDATADFDEAVPAVLYSAFGYQGQKCSACSRVIILKSVYGSFLERLIEGAMSLKVGDSRHPGTDMGPIINKEAYDSIISYIMKGEDEGAKVLLGGKYSHLDGYYIGPTIMEAERGNIITKEEIFGPVLAVMKANDFNEAMEVLNETDYALTAGLFSRTNESVDIFRREAIAGNRYINRGVTGAVVERQPFGGFKMSGAGSKAGGRNYLLHFMYSITDSINTSRSGHVPGIEDWASGQKKY